MIDNNEFRKFAVNTALTGTEVKITLNVQNMTQYVIEERPGNFRAIDVYTTNL